MSEDIEYRSRRRQKKNAVYSKPEKYKLLSDLKCHRFMFLHNFRLI